VVVVVVVVMLLLLCCHLAQPGPFVELQICGGSASHLPRHPNFLVALRLR
jgi:hypothetical protein